MSKFVLNFLFISLLFFKLSFAQIWTTFDSSNSELPANEIRSIFIDDMRAIWFGTNDGLTSFYNDIWTTFKKKDAANSLISNQINDLSGQESDNGQLLWIATEQGLSKALIISNDSLLFIDNYDQDNSGLVNNRVTTADVDANLISWFGTDSGASSFEDGNWASYTVENFWIFYNVITDIDIAPDTMIYLATEGNGISRLKIDPVAGITGASEINTIWAGYNDPEGDGLFSDSIYAIHIESNGYQWYGTNRGLSLHTSFNTRTDWQMFDKTTGLSDDFIQAIHQDKNGAMWFGTKNGLTKFSNSEWTTFFENDGLASNNVISINSDDQNIWVGTDSGISKTSLVSSLFDDQTPSVPIKISFTNYPNPFNGNTFFKFNIDYASNVRIVIYNINGQSIYQLKKEYFDAGLYNINWNGQDDLGNNLPSGIYFAAFYIDGEFHQKLKLLYIK